jgi:hypothetical protein
MAIESIQVSLKAWQRSGKPVPAAAFVDKVVIAPTDPVSKHKGPGHARVDLVSRTLDDFEGADDPATDFASDHSERMQEFVSWLAKQQPQMFEDLRRTGCVTEVSFFVVADGSEEAPDLTLSSELVAECARLGLSLSIMVNSS